MSFLEKNLPQFDGDGGGDGKDWRRRLRTMATNEPASSQRGGSSEQSIGASTTVPGTSHEDQAETLHDEAMKRLDELKAQAREKYGTDDAAELQGKLDEMVADNARKVAEYKAHLDSIDQGLAEVDKFAATASSQAHRTPGSFGDERLSITTRILPRHQIA